MAGTDRNSLPDGFHMDPQLGAVYRSNPPGADDLSVIHGIGTQEAVRLNHLGIYYVDQIALWTDEQLSAVAESVGIDASTIQRDRWTQQAKALVTPALERTSQNNPSSHSSRDLPTQRPETLPASGSRTVTVLVCALLIGCFMVVWLNRGVQQPLPGILAAEITALRVPSDSRLLASHVSAGDEVFTGETLLTLEKNVHLEQIARQQRQVKELQRELRQAEAHARLDLQWRQQEVEHEVSESMSRANLFDVLQPVSAAAVPKQVAIVPVGAVSRPTPTSENKSTRLASNSLLFFGATEPSRLMALKPVPSVVAQLLEVEVQKNAARLKQLEQIRDHLPGQVRLAAGVESVRTRYRDAVTRLKEMQELNRESDILCPGYGRIAQVRYREGDRMAKGEVMLKIQHTDRRFVSVHAPSEYLGPLEPGTAVRVVFSGHDPCYGTVADVPIVANHALANSGVTLVRVEADSHGWPDVPIGSRVNLVMK